MAKAPPLWWGFLLADRGRYRPADLNGVAAILAGLFAIGEDWRKVKPSNALLDERGDQVLKHEAAPKSQSVKEEPIMTFDNFTLDQQAHEERQVRFGATVKLYQLHSDVTGGDVLDQLQARLAQLNSMLMIIHGAGFENFNNWSDQIKQNYLWGCSMVAQECDELSFHL